jgi:hypothetical protein
MTHLPYLSVYAESWVFLRTLFFGVIAPWKTKAVKRDHSNA